MKQNRTIYFLVHSLMLTAGTATSVFGSTCPEPYRTVLLAVGTSVIAAGAAGMLLWVYLAQNETNAARWEVFSRAGLEWVYDRRAAQIRDEYATRLRVASDGIDIIGFGLTDFRRDYLEDLESISARAPVRILLLDPTSPYASKRDGEERQSPGTISSQITEFTSQFQARFGTEIRPRLQVRYYTCLPLLNVFRIDNEIFFGPYLVGKASSNTLTMRVGRGSVFDQLRSHFDEIWENHSHEI